MPNTVINSNDGSRHVDYPERSFLRSALQDLESQGVIREEFEAAIARAAK